MKREKNELTGIAVVRKLGEKLIEQHPEIADQYRNGETLFEISSRYCDNHLSESVGINAVSYALDNLLTSDERKKLERKHKHENGKNRALSFTRRFQIESAKANVLSRGMIPYDGELKRTEFGELTEQDYISSLKDSGKYNSRRGWNEITEKVNLIFGNFRSSESLSNKYFRLKNK